MDELKEVLWQSLRKRRAAMIAKVDQLTEYDQRRPLTPSGTNLLGLIKHLAGEEYGYLGDSFGRPPLERPAWFRDDPYREVDMWATPDESSRYIIDVYKQASTHADSTIAELDLSSPGRVPHWPEGSQQTTLGELMALMVAETAQHLGHADIIRELVDGRLGSGKSIDEDPAFWERRRAAVQRAADAFHVTVEPARADPAPWPDTAGADPVDVDALLAETRGDR